MTRFAPKLNNYVVYGYKQEMIHDAVRRHPFESTPGKYPSASGLLWRDAFKKRLWQMFTVQTKNWMTEN